MLKLYQNKPINYIINPIKNNLISHQKGGLSIKVDQNTFNQLIEPTCTILDGSFIRDNLCDYISTLNLRTGVDEIDSFIVNEYEKIYKENEQILKLPFTNKKSLEEIKEAIVNNENFELNTPFYIGDKHWYEALLDADCFVPENLKDKDDLLHFISSCIVEKEDQIRMYSGGITPEIGTELITNIYRKILEYNKNPVNIIKIPGRDRGLPELLHFKIDKDTVDANTLKLIFENPDNIVPGTLVKLGYFTKKGFSHMTLLYLSPTTKKPTIVENQKSSMKNKSEEIQLTEGYDKIIEFIKENEIYEFQLYVNGYEIHRNQDIDTLRDEKFIKRFAPSDLLERISSI